MRRVLKYLILLYPKAWRNRYADEFGALLDAVSPGWRTLFDVLKGAIEMQLKSGTLWKAAAVAAFAAAVAGTTFSFYTPDYRSEAVIRLDEAQLNAQTAGILSRAGLTGLIQRDDLYEKERATVPLENLGLSSIRRISHAVPTIRTRSSTRSSSSHALIAELPEEGSHPLPPRTPRGDVDYLSVPNCRIGFHRFADDPGAPIAARDMSGYLRVASPARIRHQHIARRAQLGPGTTYGRYTHAAEPC